ncbi:sensor domain-containing diguanylate cyclase [Shewanella salipaludis]|uniref:sensor domain-containing diguanylate cyclase n=1 Tax=Shewanella salipaludis TaxID=2723052 RepID=UPI00314087A1
MSRRDKLKPHRIDNLSYRYHLLLLALPMLLFVLVFMFYPRLDAVTVLPLILLCTIYLFGYSLSYYLYQGRLSRLWQHLEQVVHINDSTFELVHLSSQYQDEHAFLNALLNKAVSIVDGAEMGSIISVDPETQKLNFESCVGMDLQKLRQVSFTLEQTFEYRLTQGRCDRVVVINDMENVNSGSSLSAENQRLLLTAAQIPIRSTLSSPIHIDGKLYAMLNLDSGLAGAFSDYDRNLVGILTHEASNAISLYQKSQQIRKLASFDPLTGLYNRQRFEDLLEQWPLKSRQDSWLLLLDMDNLKGINDFRGHQQGDEAIRSLTRAMKSQWPEQALLARFGGDEFVALCEGSEQQLEQDIAALRDRLKQDVDYPLEFSVGMARLGPDWQQALKDADAAMYRQKREHKAPKAKHLG